MEPSLAQGLGSEVEKQIIKLLERNTAAGRRCHEVFRDWLELVEDLLDQIPSHCRQIRQEGRLAEDPLEMQGRWKKLREIYNARHWRDFSEAAALLLASAHRPDGTLDYEDHLGNIYMQFAYPNPGTGQYFTPFPISRMMAAMLGDIAGMVHQRIQEAIRAAGPTAEALLLAGTLATEADSERWLVEKIVPACAPFIKPVTVCDPACGSGVMFLAVASTVPPWMTQMGLVRFYGMDIDPICCRMARINLKLRGCNGLGLRNALELSELELQELPPHIKRRVEEATNAQRNGDAATVARIARAVRNHPAVQPKMDKTTARPPARKSRPNAPETAAEVDGGQTQR